MIAFKLPDNDSSSKEEYEHWASTGDEGSPHQSPWDSDDGQFFMDGDGAEEEATDEPPAKR